MLFFNHMMLTSLILHGRHWTEFRCSCPTSKNKTQNIFTHTHTNQRERERERSSKSTTFYSFTFYLPRSIFVCILWCTLNEDAKQRLYKLGKSNTNPVHSFFNGILFSTIITTVKLNCVQFTIICLYWVMIRWNVSIYKRKVDIPYVNITFLKRHKHFNIFFF